MTSNLHACEIAREVGYDIVVLDLEHGTWNPESVDRAIASPRRSG
jgi:2-keto-3-deoxy-L-rhamnonate aldolase RhmA